MKRLIAIILTLTLGLAGCASSEDQDSSQNMMSYDTDMGTVEYVANPTIYADYYVGQLLYLGGDVIGADMTYPAETWTSVAEEKGVQNISNDMEAVAALAPDLIVTMNADFYEQYSAIAPTILIPYGTYNQEDIVVELGKVLGKEEEANKWVSEFNANIETLKTEIDDPAKTIGIVDSWGGAMYMYGANFGRGGYILYDKLGLQGTEKAEDEYVRDANSYLTVDAESLTNYAGDVLFICATDEGVKEVESLPTYEDLEAVQNDQVIVLDYDTFLYDDPYSLNAQIEVLTEIYGSEDL
ncbi:ABC transporter substrate-binding protein [Mollicutes bacterium LVI A0078]|nr:ABC transporter substrate-binding protein [Mollicutes bacterium LVI A0075]WOO91546.1 ABC transporter substrate-binding protein [Mollicutes bacterium LVI A0078]